MRHDHRKIILIVSTILVIGATSGLFLWKWIMRPNESTSEKESIARLSADSLTKDFEMNDSIATVKFAGKIVEVEGVIEEKSNDNGIIRLRLKGTDMSGIICQIEAKDSALIAGKGEGATVCIKGQCNTYQKVELLPGGDVLFSNCVLMDYKK